MGVSFHDIFGRLNLSDKLNEAVVKRNNWSRKATSFAIGLLVFTGRKKIIFILNLQQNCKNHLTNSPKCLQIVKKGVLSYNFIFIQLIW